MRQPNSGFTIVELLIVIVVISILSALTFVSYSGISKRSVLGSAKADLNALSKQASLYRVDDGTYPASNAAWKIILQNANLYDSTRSRYPKSFVFCAKSDSVAIIAFAPVSGDMTDGELYYYSDGAALKTFEWDTAVTGSYISEKACKQTTVGSGATSAWSYGV